MILAEASVRVAEGGPVGGDMGAFRGMSNVGYTLLYTAYKDRVQHVKIA